MSLTNRLPARFTLAHGLMILAALLTFVLVNRALNDNRATQPAFFATENAVAGRTFVPDVRDVVASTPGLELYATEDELRTKVLVRTVPPGEPIMSSDLIDRGNVNYRLFTVPVDAYHISGLGLERNDRVDVVGFDDDGQPLYLATELVVETTSASAVVEGLGGAARDSYVTVQVNEEQALQLALGQNNGDLHLVRSTGAGPIAVPAVNASADDVADDIADDESAEGEQP